MSTPSHVEPSLLSPGQGRILPQIGTVKASAALTSGAFEVIEYTGPATPPPHIHRLREEAFYVLAGSFTFVLGDETVDAPTGSFVFVPRGTRHGFTVRPGSRALLWVSPAGLEGFFAELGEGLEAGRSGADIRAALAGRYDSTPVRQGVCWAGMAPRRLRPEQVSGEWEPRLPPPTRCAAPRRLPRPPPSRSESW